MSRTERFPPDGKRRLVSPVLIVAAWRAETDRIPAQFALGTAAHESSLTINEVDTEESGYRSIGLYQLGEADPKTVKLTGADLYTLEGNTRVFVRLCLRNLEHILTAAQLGPNLRDYSTTTKLPPDVWAYLHIAHNQGAGAAVKTIKRYGLDWAAYKKRNLDEARFKKDKDKIRFFTKVASYGDDVISGGEHWRKSFEATP